MQLDGKVAVITGGGSGIGRATALLLARHGAKLVISDVNIPGGEESVRLIQQAGGQACFIETDVTQAGQVELLIKGAVDAFGGLHYAVNNAGVGGGMQRLDLLEEADWNRVIDVNLKGVWLCMKYEVPHMLASGGGAIVNVASAAGLVGFRYNAVYAASKHGVVGLTKSAALEFARKGIRVNAICPGFTATPMVSELEQNNPRMMEATVRAVPMRRLGTPEEIAEAVLWLCSDESSFVTGHALAVDGGTVVQ